MRADPAAGGRVEFESIFAAAPTSYVLLDRDLRIVWANPAYLAVTDRDLPSLLGKVLMEEFPPPDAQAEQILRGSLDRVLERGAPDHIPWIAYPIALSDGSVEKRYWSATHTPVLGADGEVEFILQQTHDVTDLYEDRSGENPQKLQSTAQLLKRAEAVAVENLELGSASEFFQTVLLQAPSIMAISLGPDHRIQIANDTYLALLPGRDIIGRTPREFAPELEGQGYFDLLDEVYRTRQPASRKASEVVLVDPGSNEPRRLFVDFVYQPLLDKNGQSIGIFVQGHDVTHSVLAERELREAESRFRRLAQNLPAHSWTATPDGALDWASDQVYRYTGGEDGSVLGAQWADVLHPEDIERVSAIWAESIAQGVRYETEFRIRAADGSYRWFIVRAEPVRDGEGRVIQWIGTNTDIEDRKSAERALTELNATLEARVEERNRELQEVNAALRHSQKMEAVGTLAGGVAHDFNNLLQTISGSLQLAQRQVPADSPVQERLGQALTAVERGAKLSSQLLSFGRRQLLAPQSTHLGRLLGESDRMLRTAAGEGVEVDFVTSPDLWTTMVDRSNFENAVLNLVVNARDAMAGRGRLSVRLDNTRVTPGEALGTELMPGDYVTLTVRDTGPGIPPELLDKVFEPFFTTKSEGRGTGLGLAMVYGFARQSDGLAMIRSEPGEGTEVTLYLPRALEPEVEATAPPTETMPGGNERVLLVEDDEAVRDVVEEMLIDLGYQVVTAEDADAAAPILVPGKFDLLLSDVMMPGEITSRQLAALAMQRDPGLRVLFTSGYTHDAMLRDGRLEEGIELLAKPYSRAALARRIREVLNPAAGAPRDAGAPRAATAAATDPRALDAMPPAGAVKRAAPSPGAGLKVLVCEDDPLIRMDLAMMLEEAGHSPLETGRGAEALARFEAEGADLLLADLGLPDMDGVELARRAREIRQDLPVLFATGQASLPDNARMPRVALLTKPYGETALVAAIDKLMAAAV